MKTSQMREHYTEISVHTGNVNKKIKYVDGATERSFPDITHAGDFNDPFKTSGQ